MAAEQDLQSLPPDVFASRWIFENIPHVFKGDLDAYVAWKSFLADGLDVDPRAICIVGSASVGISLNPAKAGKRFDDSSDVDVAVISYRYFEAAWHYLRVAKAQRLGMAPKARYALRAHGPDKVFYGSIATDIILEYLPFGRTWVPTLASMSGRDPTLGRDVKARIYRDFESLREYQLRGVTIARNALGAGGAVP